MGKRMSDTCMIPTCEATTTCLIDEDWNLYFCNNHIVGIESKEIRIPIVEFFNNRIEPERALTMFAIQAGKVGIQMVVQYDIPTNTCVIQFHIP